MLSRLLQRRARLAGEGGFTLIELLVVIVIIGILLAIAVPSYLGFKDRANKSAAQSNVRAAFPSAETFYSDNGTYTGMDAAGALTAIDAGVKVTKTTVPAGGATYELCAVSGNWVAKGTGPNHVIAAPTDAGHTATAADC